MFPSTRTGSTWSWEKAGLKLARALSTLHSGGICGAGWGRWHCMARTGRSVNRSCRQQTGLSHLPHGLGAMEGTRTWDYGKADVFPQAVLPSPGRDGPAGPVLSPHQP